MPPPIDLAEDTELLRRLVGFELSLSREAADLVEPFGGGTLVVNNGIPRIWRASYVELERAGGSAEEIARLADELLGARGIAHRHVALADPRGGEALAAGFTELEGWEVDRSLYMALRRPPARGGAEAVEVEPGRVEAVRREVAAEEGRDAETVEQMLARDARFTELAGGRWFAAPDDGEPASTCVLYSRGGAGQVETVVTRPHARGRGLASGAVLAALEASRLAGNELTFIVADADDWPWRLYERLGFDPVGVAHGFLRRAPADLA